MSATGVAAAVSPSADAAAAQQPPGRTPPVALPAPSGYTFFTAPEAAFVEAAADWFILADEPHKAARRSASRRSSIGSLRAPGAAATGCTCRGRGRRVRRHKAISHP